MRLQFVGAAAREIAERRWHESQRLTWTGAEELVLELQVTDTGGLERWVLGFASDAKVLEPDSLADRIRELHRAAAESEPYGAVRLPRPESFSSAGKRPFSKPAAAANIARRRTRK